MSDLPFPSDVVDSLKRTFIANDFQVRLAHETYVSVYRLIDGAPAPDKLTSADTIGVFYVGNYSYDNKEGWAKFLLRVSQFQTKVENAANPFLPNWNQKTETTSTIWYGDTAPKLADVYQSALTDIFAKASPKTTDGNLAAKIGLPPTSDIQSVQDVAVALEFVSGYLMQGAGYSTDEAKMMWRWSRPLCMLAGLGFETLRHFARQTQDEESDWAHWAVCSDKELLEDVLEAQKISGYPISLLRADYVDLQHKCAEADISPKWLHASLAVHLFKHARFVTNNDGTYSLWYGYRGETGYIPLEPENLCQSLGDDINKYVKKSLCTHLRIRNAPAAAAQPIDDIINQVFKKIHPKNFPKPRDLREASHLIIAPAVRMTPAFDTGDEGEYEWIRTGLKVTNVAGIDYTTGDVNQITVTGSQVAALQWPQGSLSAGDKADWLAKLPKSVLPKRPSEIYKDAIPNLNYLGHEAGFHAITDAMVILDLIRDQLAGSSVGMYIKKEYPLYVVYPMGHTLEDTTNQGKTMLAKILARTLVPDLEHENAASKSTSAPTQRTVAVPLEKHGTAILDEFQLPGNPDHFLAQAGLQSLLTGGRGGPGRAGENSEGITLKHPLFMTCKVSAFPPDLRNRSFPAFMDTLIKDGPNKNISSMEHLAMLGTGQLSTLIRLSTLMWIERTFFVERVKALTLVSGISRFDAHNAVAALLTPSGTIKEVDEYLKAAEAQLNIQQRQAEESGLSENIGALPTFDGVREFQSMSDFTLKRLEDECKRDMTPLNALRHIVEDSANRKFSDTIRTYGREPTLVRMFTKAVEAGRMTRSDGWTLSFEYRVLKKGDKSRKGLVLKKALVLAEAAEISEDTKSDLTA